MFHINSVEIVNFSNLPFIKSMARKKSLGTKKISVVVPVYNEIGIIKAFHADLLASLLQLKKPFEIIYVDDRSTDGTYEWLIENSTMDVKSNMGNEGVGGSRGDDGVEYSVTVYSKTGKKGKAFSLIEGFEKAKGSIFVMIDGDMQYPPSVIPEMIKKLSKTDIVIADRKYENISFLRKLFSKTFRFLFGKKLFNFDSDIQSGLKVFKRSVYDTVKFKPLSPWTFDLEFLHRATQAGFRTMNHFIAFSDRKGGYSKVNVIASTLEIGLNAILVRLKGVPPLFIPPAAKSSMRGAGIGFKNKKYITHTTLSHKESALRTFGKMQLFIILALLISIIIIFAISPLIEMRIVVTVLSVLYFVDSLFNLYLILKSIRKPVEVSFDDKMLKELDDESLPVYSILCPLYKEAKLIPQFLEAIAKLDYPKNKLDVMLLLEEDDKETIDSVSSISLPYYFRTVIVPDSLPKTKPKACNYGLSYAKGEYLVIYDAEDIPDPMQLKKAYLGFKTLPSNIVCLQAKLNYYNPGQNLLTRFFTAEYSLWFDLTLTGLQSLNSSIPLGGTSNHFRTKDLRDLQGWDPFNVTEDADLGVRLFKKGFKTAIIDSTTLEEANSNLGNWLRQRSRWIKGYFQTYFVQTRDFWSFVRTNGLKHAFIFQLTIGGKLLFLLINPFMWVMTFLYFAFYNEMAPVIERVFFAPMSYVAVFSWVFGNFLFLYYYMVACAKRNQWSLVKYVYFIPLYWAMMSHAAGIALYQLIIKPHYWEKTIHGFHLGRKSTVEAVSKGRRIPIITPSILPKLRPNFSEASSGYQGILQQTQKQTHFETKSESIKAVEPDKNTFKSFALSFTFGTFFKSLTVLLYYILFIGGDVLLVHTVYPAAISIEYLYLSIIGKSIFAGSQFVSFLSVQILRKLHVEMKETREVSYSIFITFLASWICVIIFGFQIYPDFSNFLNLNISAISFILPSITIAMMCYAMANVLVLHNLRKNINTFFVISYVVLALQLGVIYFLNSDLIHLVQSTVYLAGAYALLMFILHLNKDYIRVFENNIGGLFGLLSQDSIRKSWEEKRMKILIFNWRDTKHKFAGGAEVYVHELAKRWVKQGNKVTIFCGNDNKHKSNETVEGVEVVRRGGTYTVYLFAFIYYIFKFRGKYDLIIDCENGIPFFTPLYVNKPVILVIHHVHQKIIQRYLRFPINIIASLLEAKMMPVIYRNKKVVTVSDSSKEEIIKLGFINEEDIEIIHNGKAIKNTVFTPKTEYPTFLYLGRLQDYKNIDVAIAAFAKVVKKYNKAKLKIVGYGESLSKLKKLSVLLQIENSVEFLGKVTDTEKINLLSESWAAIHPSQIEGWGITVIEANACGTPVIASRVNGLRDSVVDGKTGILVEYRNVDEFAKAMTRLIRNPQLRNNLSREAYVWSKNFNWNKSANLFYDLIGRSIITGNQISDTGFQTGESGLENSPIYSYETGE